MIIMCEKCEKKFRVDPTRITGEQARFRCRNCGNIMIVSRPPTQPPQPPPSVPEPQAFDRMEESRPFAAPSFQLASAGTERPEGKAPTGEFASASESAAVEKIADVAERPSSAPIEETASGEGTTPETEPASTEEEPASTEEEPAPAEEEKAPAEEEKAPAEEEKAPAEEEKAPAEEVRASGAEVSVPSEEEASTAVEESALAAPARRFGSMKPRIVFLFLFAGLVPLIAFAGVMIFLVKSQLATEVGRANVEASSTLVRQVDELLDENLQILNTVAALAEMTSMDSARQEPVLKVVAAKTPSIELLCSVGPDGMSLSRSDGQPAANFEDRPFYREIMEGKPLAWQRPPSSSDRGDVLVLAVPITRKGQVVGILAGFVKIEALSAPVLEWKHGKTGTAFLLDENARVIAHPQQEFTLTQADFSSHPLGSKLKTGGGPAAFAVDSRKHVGHVSKTRLGWGVAVQQEESEMYGLFQKTLLYGGIILGCGALLILLIAMSVARSLVRPLRELTEAADRISVGDLGGEIAIRSRDELGALADAMSRLQESIRLSIERLRRRQ